MTTEQSMAYLNSGSLRKDGSFRMPLSLAEMCQLNSAAVMLEDDERTARSILENCLHQVVRGLNNNEFEEGKEKEGTRVLQVESVAATDSGGVVLTMTRSQSLSPHNSFHLFDCMLRPEEESLLNTDLMQQHQQLQRGQHLQVLSILLYNSALCYHRAGLRSSNAELELETAQEVYRLALRALKQNNFDSSPILGLAILNNLGHINSHFCRRSWALEYQDQLRSLFCLVATSLPYREQSFFMLAVSVPAWNTTAPTA